MLDPRRFVVFKPLPLSSPERNTVRSGTVYSGCNRTREDVFWENRHRRQKQLARQGHQSAAWRPYEELGEPLCLEPKTLILDSLGQTPKAETGEDDVDLFTTNPPNFSQENKTFPLNHTRPRRRADTHSLKKHLWNSRNMVVAVRQGRGYFHLLREQEQAEQLEERRRREERKGSASITSDSDGGVKRSASAGVLSSPLKHSNNRRVQSARPFTPVHQSLTSDQPQQLAGEHMYRQLCCLNWLLESLTLDRSGRHGPVTSCWDAKDPGRSKTGLKTLNKEKAIQAEWEQFVSTPKSLRSMFKLSRMCSARPLTRKCSSISVMSSVATTSSLGSVSSLVPGNRDGADVIVSSEDSDPQSTAGSQLDPPVSEYLQMLLDEVHHSVSKDMCGTGRDCRRETNRESLRPANHVQANVATGRLESHRPKRVIVLHNAKKQAVRETQKSSSPCHRKAAMLSQTREEFEERMEELNLSLTDALQHNARNKWLSGLQRFQSLSNIAAPSSLTSSVTCVTSKSSVQDSKKTDATGRHYTTQWLSALLNRLSLHTHSDVKLARVLDKLRCYAEEPTLWIRPHVFLRVLNSLQPWELCCPDLCVAIEIVRENAVQMSVAEYDSWLHTRISLPKTPPQGVNHTP
ncbi:coiled-coil domain-containing protein 60-like isoform X2 [Brachyhypopomus gauderio]|uniref:coiled-coil domain-containing protein 60-like isoform X2 n=1 Tax=Brachyhypopomus gauderio TaxID=698409 RepID=UPI004042AA01